MAWRSTKDSECSQPNLNCHTDFVAPLEKINASAQEFDALYDGDFVRRTVRRADWRILPLLGTLYAVAIVDRLNLAAARTAGMEQDLKLNVGDRYSIVSMVYFIPYAICELPGNLILGRLGARLLLTICVLGWGTAQLAMAFVPNWGLLCMCRVFLGIFEAGFFPCLVFIITTWYKRHEVQVRLALFYIGAALCGSFSNVLAFGLTRLHGKAGLNGWQWIFLVEGVFTILLGGLTWFFVADFPHKATFLDAQERKMILARVEADRGDSCPDEITWRSVLRHLADPMIWTYPFLLFAAVVPAYATAFFLTVILHAMGYSEGLALLLTCPPGVFAALMCFVVAYLSDKVKLRAPFLVMNYTVCAVGLAMTAFTASHSVRYAGIFLIHGGSGSSIPAILAYGANNITSYSKRAAQTAITISAGGIGGIVATTVFRQKDYPRYTIGMSTAIGLQFLAIVAVCTSSFIFERRNGLRRKGKIGPLEGQDGFYYTI